MTRLRRLIARLCDARVAELERERDEALADAALARRERDDLERELRGVQARHRADVEAYALEAAARLGGAGMCWGGVADA